jgi:serine/threonine-protein kinase
LNLPEIAGRYRLERRLGSGGMSTVQLAFDTRLERYVAVKLLAEHLAEDPTFVSRFQREAMAAARLIHPNNVQVFDSGLDQRTGQHYIVMEYIAGQSCAEILRERGWLAVDETLAIILGSCEGLDYAHRKGVVHRDVKPGNLMLAEDGRVKLADFGIAKATEQASITQTGSDLATAAYLAPEQGRGEDAGPPADIYALGVVTYQLLAGRLPYEGASLTELALKQQQERPPPLDELVAGVTPELADAVAIALRLDPGQRYRTALDMAQALEDGANGIPAEHIGPVAAPAKETAPTSATRILPHEDSATRVVPTPAAPPPVAPAPRQPRPGPPRQAPARAAVPAPLPPRRTGRSLAVLAAVAVAGALIAVLLLSGGGGGGGGGAKQAVRLTPVSSHGVPTIVNDLKTLVGMNTG